MMNIGEGCLHFAELQSAADGGDSTNAAGSSGGYTAAGVSLMPSGNYAIVGGHGDGNNGQIPCRGFSTGNQSSSVFEATGSGLSGIFAGSATLAATDSQGGDHV